MHKHSLDATQQNVLYSNPIQEYIMSRLNISLQTTFEIISKSLISQRKKRLEAVEFSNVTK